MSILQTFVLRAHDHSSRQRAAKWMLEGPEGTVIQCKEPTRSLEANARLHALLGEIAAEREWAGKKRDIEAWKRLMVAAWMRAKGESVEVLPAIDGHGVDIVYSRTSELSPGEISDLMEFVEAWRAMN